METVKRDRKGWFLPGTKAGPGRPPGAVNEVAGELRQRIANFAKEGLTFEELCDMRNRAVEAGPKDENKFWALILKHVLPAQNNLQVNDIAESLSRDEIKDKIRDLVGVE